VREFAHQRAAPGNSAFMLVIEPDLSIFEFVLQSTLLIFIEKECLAEDESKDQFKQSNDRA
jgi:hypothetical protein